MTEKEIRKYREVLFVLQQLLLRCLMYDALKTDDAEPLNFFRVYRGALMDGIVVDWWNVFGNRKDESHWKKILPKGRRDNCLAEIGAAMETLSPPTTPKETWESVRKYRNTSVAHLSFHESNRAQRYPQLLPLRISAEIVYRQIFELLAEHGQTGGFPPPNGMTGESRDRVLSHNRELAKIARAALSGCANSP